MLKFKGNVVKQEANDNGAEAVTIRLNKVEGIAFSHFFVEFIGTSPFKLRDNLTITISTDAETSPLSETAAATTKEIE